MTKKAEKYFSVILTQLQEDWFEQYLKDHPTVRKADVIREAVDRLMVLRPVTSDPVLTKRILTYVHDNQQLWERKDNGHSKIQR